MPSIFDDSAFDYTLPPIAPEPHDDDEVLPAYTATADMSAWRPIRTAPTPLGPPCGDRPATFGQLSLVALHKARPVRLIRIAWNPETWVPTAIYNDDGTTKLFTVTMPAFVDTRTPTMGKLPISVNRDFLPYKGKAGFGGKKDEPAWDTSNPHIRLCSVSSATESDGNAAPCKETEVTSARLFEHDWQAQIFRPVDEASSTSGEEQQEVPNIALNIERSQNTMTWRSTASRGQLTWRWPGTTAMSCHTHVRICFDVYERPVAAHIDGYPAGTRSKRSAVSPPGQGYTWRGLQSPVIPAPPDVSADGREPTGTLSRMALYADVNDDLLAEMLMGFIIMCAQARRYDVLTNSDD